MQKMQVWTRVGAFISALVGALEGGVGKSEPQNKNELTIQTDTHVCVESRKQDLEGMSICEQHTCNISTRDLSYTCMGLHPQFSFTLSKPQTPGKGWNIMGGYGNVYRIAML